MRTRARMRTSAIYGRLKALLILAAMVLVCVLLYKGCQTYRESLEVVTITVKEKDRISQGSGETVTHQYMVFTEEGEVFKNTDDFILGKNNSSDVQGRLTVGRKYKVRVAGWRSRVWSEYRNIIEVISEVR